VPTKEQIEESLRSATRTRRSVRESSKTTPLDRATANAEFYNMIQRAVDADVLTLQEIANLTDISRQRVWQIVRTPQVVRRLRSASKPTETQLPKEDV
jgi:Spy/CpxP family protein refolding chaperone